MDDKIVVAWYKECEAEGCEGNQRTDGLCYRCAPQYRSAGKRRGWTDQDAEEGKIVPAWKA